MSIEEQEILRKNQATILSWLKAQGISTLAMIGMFVYIVRKDALTFENQKERYEIISSYPEMLRTHINDNNRHMSFEEKQNMRIWIQDQQRLIEQQKATNEILIKYGGDLQEIKNLSKRRTE